MSTGLIVVIVIVVVIVAAAAVVLPAQLRSRRLRNRFGPEYDHVVGSAEDRRAAERHLAEREQRHTTFQLTELTHERRVEYLGRWSTIQEQFVDEPRHAVQQADRLMTEVMAEIGYPTDGFDQQAADLSVRYATNVGQYRKAHELVEHAGTPGTDDLRQALLDYRELVKSLLGATENENETARA